MKNDGDKETRRRHLKMTEPSPWVRRFAPLIPGGGAVLDLASGNGRHGRFLGGLGHKVVAVDRDTSALEDLASAPDISGNIEVIEADLETETSIFAPKKPLAGRTFAGIVVVNYLHRALMEDLIGALEPGGVLIYETFARGNEQFVRPRNPDHLLKSGELLKLVEGRLQVVAYEHGLVEAADMGGVKQRICAVNDLGISDRDDGEPAPHPVTPGDQAKGP